MNLTILRSVRFPSANADGQTVAIGATRRRRRQVKKGRSAMRRIRHRLSGAALAAGLAPLVVSLVAQPARAGSASLDL